MGYPAFASFEEDIRTGFIGDGLQGFVVNKHETKPSTVREARFYFDGEVYRLVIANRETIRIGQNRLNQMWARDPDGPWQSFRLHFEDWEYVVGLDFRADAGLEFSRDVTFEGKVRSTPRILITVIEKRDNTVLYHGALLSLDQEPGVLSDVLGYYGRLKQVTFKTAEERTCSELIDLLRIRVRE